MRAFSLLLLPDVDGWSGDKKHSLSCCISPSTAFWYWITSMICCCVSPLFSNIKFSANFRLMSSLCANFCSDETKSSSESDDQSSSNSSTASSLCGIDFSIALRLLSGLIPFSVALMSSSVLAGNDSLTMISSKLLFGTTCFPVSFTYTYRVTLSAAILDPMLEFVTTPCSLRISSISPKLSEWPPISCSAFSRDTWMDRRFSNLVIW